MKRIEDVIEKSVVQHEVGHLVSLILFAKMDISKRKITSLRFYLKHPEYKGMVESEGRIDGFNAYSAPEEVRKVIKEILPALINSMSGYIAETLFDSSENFEARFERRDRFGMNKDFQNVNNLRNYIANYTQSISPIDFASCINIAEQYMRFLKSNFSKELTEIVEYVLKMDLKEVINAEGDILIFKNQVFDNLVKLIESLMRPEFISAASKWYKELELEYNVQFKKET